MIDPKETLRICGEYAAEVADVPNLETRFDVYAVEALPEYAAWVKDAVPLLEGCRKIIADEWGSSTLVEELLQQVSELLARVKCD